MSRSILERSTVTDLQSAITAYEALFFYALPDTLAVVVDSQFGPQFAIAIDSAAAASTCVLSDTGALSTAIAIMGAGGVGPSNLIRYTDPSLGDRYLVARSTLSAAVASLSVPYAPGVAVTSGVELTIGTLVLPRGTYLVTSSIKFELVGAAGYLVRLGLVQGGGNIDMQTIASTQYSLDTPATPLLAIPLSPAVLLIEAQPSVNLRLYASFAGAMTAGCEMQAIPVSWPM